VLFWFYRDVSRNEKGNKVKRVKKGTIQHPDAIISVAWGFRKSARSRGSSSDVTLWMTNARCANARSALFSTALLFDRNLRAMKTRGGLGIPVASRFVCTLKTIHAGRGVLRASISISHASAISGCCDVGTSGGERTLFPFLPPFPLSLSLSFEDCRDWRAGTVKQCEFLGALSSRVMISPTKTRSRMQPLLFVRQDNSRDKNGNVQTRCEQLLACQGTCLRKRKSSARQSSTLFLSRSLSFAFLSQDFRHSELFVHNLEIKPKRTILQKETYRFVV